MGVSSVLFIGLGLGRDLPAVECEATARALVAPRPWRAPHLRPVLLGVVRHDVEAHLQGSLRGGAVLGVLAGWPAPVASLPQTLQAAKLVERSRLVGLARLLVPHPHL